MNATAQRTVTSSPGVGVELEPEVVLPSQFHIRGGLDASLQPEKRLMLAVMEDAVGTFQKYVWALRKWSLSWLICCRSWLASWPARVRSLASRASWIWLASCVR